jgi:hypothetical protein
MIKNDLKLDQEQYLKVFQNLENQITKVEAELSTAMYQQSLNIGSFGDDFYFDRCFIIRKLECIKAYLLRLRERFAYDCRDEVNVDRILSELDERVQLLFMRTPKPSSGLFGIQQIELDKSIAIGQLNHFKEIVKF